MKKLLLMLLLFIPLMGFCQLEEKQNYIYNIVSFEGDFTKEDFKVYYDDGIEVKRMRNDKGEILNTRRRIDVFYFSRLGDVLKWSNV